MVGLGGQGACERRIEVFVKIQKKTIGGGGSGWWRGRVGGGQGGCERGEGKGQCLNPKHPQCIYKKKKKRKKNDRAEIRTHNLRV